MQAGGVSRWRKSLLGRGKSRWGGRCLVCCGYNRVFVGSVKKTASERTADRRVIKVIMGNAK